MGIDVRELVKGDRDAVSRILQTCGGFTSEEIRVALELVDEALARGVDSDYLVFVAERQNEVCGYVCIGRTPLTASTWHLYWLCVDGRVQGVGVGRALESHAEAFARNRGCERLVLETSSQPWYDKVRRFYEQCGYTQVGRIANFYKSNDDCIIYCKELAA